MVPAAELSSRLPVGSSASNVLAGGQTRDEVVELEDETNLLASVLGQAVQVHQVVAGRPDRAGVRSVQRGEQVQQSGLARPRRSGDHHELAGLDLEGHPVDDPGVAEAADQIANGHERLPRWTAIQLG